MPYRTYSLKYDLEYGQAELHMHVDGIAEGARVLMVDDLLATGGTAKAAVGLVKRLGGDVHSLAFLIELVALDGRKQLAGERLHTVLKY